MLLIPLVSVTQALPSALIRIKASSAVPSNNGYLGDFQDFQKTKTMNVALTM